MTNRMACIVLFCAVAICARAQTLTTLATFDGTNGASPYLMSLVQGLDGNLYGTTYSGGTYNVGTVFEVDTAGALTTLYSFCSTALPCTGGFAPFAGLVQAIDGDFYGTTALGGTNAVGAVFKITPTGALTWLYNFCSEPSCIDGSYPEGALIQAQDGNLFGTTRTGGTNGSGTVFEITT